jgi:hypothetical protein
MPLTRLFLGETAMLANMVAQIPTREHVHHEIEILPILEGIVHIDDERVVELGENLPLVHDRLNTALCDNACL